MSNILPIGKWGWVLAGSWVEWLVMLPKVLRQAQDERGVGSVVWFAFCRARGALLQGSSREWFFGVFCVLPECAQKIRHQPVSGFAAGRDACGRACGALAITERLNVGVIIDEVEQRMLALADMYEPTQTQTSTRPNDLLTSVNAIVSYCLGSHGVCLFRQTTMRPYENA